MAKCLRSFSHAKSYRISFRFTPKLSDQVVVITEESDFYTRYCRNKLHDSKKGKKRGFANLSLWQQLSLFEMLLKNGFLCSLTFFCFPNSALHCKGVLG